MKWIAHDLGERPIGFGHIAEVRKATLKNTLRSKAGVMSLIVERVTGVREKGNGIMSVYVLDINNTRTKTKLEADALMHTIETCDIGVTLGSLICWYGIIEYTFRIEHRGNTYQKYKKY